MTTLARKGKLNPLIRQKASELVAHLRQKDWGAEIAALFFFVRDQIRYLRDINNVETLHEADRVLTIGLGDCDDKCILLASMLETIGHPARFVALSFDGGQFSHVIVETLLGKPPRGRWLALDPTENVAPGWYPPKVTGRMVRHI